MVYFLLYLCTAIQAMMSKAEKTRMYIIEKAAPVFNTKGYAGTSMNDITEATGLTKGSIYGNFENKDEVALAVYDYNLARVTNALQDAIDRQSNAADKLIAMAEFYSTRFKSLTTYGGCAILNTAVEADDSHPALRKKAADSLKSWKKRIETIIHDGIKKKEIQPDTKASEIAITCIALIEGGIMMAKATGDTGMLNTALKRVKTIVTSELKL